MQLRKEGAILKAGYDGLMLYPPSHPILLHDVQIVNQAKKKCSRDLQVARSPAR